METAISVLIGLPILALVLWSSTGAMFSRRFTREELSSAPEQPTGDVEDPGSPVG